VRRRILDSNDDHERAGLAGPAEGYVPGITEVNLEISFGEARGAPARMASGGQESAIEQHNRWSTADATPAKAGMRA